MDIRRIYATNLKFATHRLSAEKIASVHGDTATIAQFSEATASVN